MGYLTHGRSTVGVHPSGEFAKVRHDGVVACIEIAVSGGRVPRDQSAAPEHRKTNAPFGLFFVVQPIALLGQAVLRISRFMTGRHDAVFERQVFQRHRLQQRISLGIHGITLALRAG